MNDPALEVADNDSRELADELTPLAREDTVILALSPAAVEFAFSLSQRLGCELDLLLVGQISAPGHPEHSIGSILDLVEPQLVVDEVLARQFHLPPGYLSTEAERQRSELDRRHLMYHGDQEVRHDHAGKNVVIIDDGSNEQVLKLVMAQAEVSGARSIRVVSHSTSDIPSVEDTKVAHMLKEARRLYRQLH